MAFFCDILSSIWKKNIIHAGLQNKKSSWPGLMPDLIGMVLEFLSNREGSNCFSRHVLPKLSELNNCALSKVSKKDRISWILTCQKLVKYINFELLKVTAKWLVWKSICLSHWDARNITFGHLIWKSFIVYSDSGGSDVISS